LEAVPQPDSKFADWVTAMSWPEGESEPKWDAPEGWKKGPPPDRMALASMDTGVEGEQVTITRLPNNPGMGQDEYMLLNVNRWRKQLGLPGWDTQQMREQARPLPFRDGLSVTLQGRIPRASKNDDVADSSPLAPPGSTPRSEPEREAAAPPRLTYATPEGWEPGPPVGFSQVSLQAASGEQKVVVTVTAAGGELAANVNRWRGQLGLPQQSPDEIEAAAIPVEIAALSGKLFELSAEGRAIYGVVAPDDGVTWFVKMVGDAALAERERQHYRDFLKSIRFESP
jgi:hypothetical protein